MNNKIKVFVLSLLVITLSGCSLPLQQSSYPAWATKGVLESYTLIDGRFVDGWMGANIMDKLSAKWYDFTVNSVEFVNGYTFNLSSGWKTDIKLENCRIT